MKDEHENVEAGSETSGESAEAETSQEETTETDTAGVAADETSKSSETSGESAPDAEQSRTGFVKGLRAGEQCMCPDGRKGTVHKFDEGSICIPNHDQG